VSRTRDRHGRGVRGQFAPPAVPLSRTAARRFDETLLDVLDHLESHGITELADVDFAVEDVPPVPATFDTQVLEDGGVPLARCVAADASGGKATIVMYRRPLEARAVDEEDLEDLLHEAVIDRLAHLLGRDPEDLDPHS
jgi:predicted Zn-dependent protease with MMP-like domain